MTHPPTRTIPSPSVHPADRTGAGGPLNLKKHPCEEVLEFVRRLAIQDARRDHEAAQGRAMAGSKQEMK